MRRLQQIPVKYRREVEDLQKKVSDLLQRQRRKLGMSQEEFAEDVNLSVDTIKAIETGRRVPSLQMLFYLCSRLKIEVDFTAK